MKQGLFAAILFILLGCTHQFWDEGEYFHIQNGDAVMPVWIRGNSAGSTYIIFIHGGPGSSAVAEATLGKFRKIENECALVYWDQRGAGLSDGNPAEITNELIAEDLDILVDVLREKYGAQKVVLMGHSYGAIVSSCYLSDSLRRSKIDGWIVIDGTENLKENWKHSIAWVKEKIETENSSHRQDALSWYDEISKRGRFTSHDEVQRHLGYVDSLGGKFYSDENRVSGSAEQVFFSPIGLGMVSNEKSCGSKVSYWWESDYSGAVPDIEIPLLLLSGVHDGIIPDAAADSLYERIGTVETLKKRVSFSNSGHHPHYEETDLFNSEVISFLSIL